MADKMPCGGFYVGDGLEIDESTRTLNVAGGGGTSVQPDWQQNDETAPDYVKNRPGAYDEYDVNITWDGVVGDRLTVVVTDSAGFVKVSDQVLTVDQINGSTVELSSGDKLGVDGVASNDSVVNDVLAFVSTPGYVNNKATFPESGIYFVRFVEGAQSLYTASLTSAPTPVKIPQKYLEPNNTLGITSATIGQIAKITAVDDSGRPTAWKATDVESDNIVLASSTAGSTKKFRITVNDSGTLSATEVASA